ncbi:MAG: class I SAM-dependent methyltransferase [Eubacterium sp.]
MYSAEYDDYSIRSRDIAFVDFITPYLNKNMNCVDLGCGTCRKVLRFASLVNHIDGIDRNDLMLKQAKLNIYQENCRNVDLFLGDNFCTPFRSHSYDLCTSCLSQWSTIEIRRLLKSNGIFCFEMLMPDDKEEIKKAFGKDRLGWRGYMSNCSKEEKKEYLLRELNEFFEIVNISEYIQSSSLSRDGFVKLLHLTPTIRDFDIEKDDEYIKSLLVNGKIKFTEKRWFVCAIAKA